MVSWIGVGFYQLLAFLLVDCFLISMELQILSLKWILLRFILLGYNLHFLSLYFKKSLLILPLLHFLSSPPQITDDCFLIFYRFQIIKAFSFFPVESWYLVMHLDLDKYFWVGGISFLQLFFFFLLFYCFNLISCLVFLLIFSWRMVQHQ